MGHFAYLQFSENIPYPYISYPKIFVWLCRCFITLPVPSIDEGTVFLEYRKVYMVILIYMLKTVKYFRHVLPAENPFHITSISRNCSSFHEEQSGAYFLKLVSAIFYRTFISYQMIALQKLCKILFISYKKLFSLSRFSYFSISTFTSFSPSQPLL